MEDDKVTKQIRKKTDLISLKDIPPLVPSSIPNINSSSLKPRRTMVPVNVAKQRYEELKLKKVNEVEEEVKSISSFSNIQIDPNSTRSLLSINTHEKKLVPKPVEEDTKPNSKDESKKGSAKSVLHERCASKHWRPPVYDCCKVDGPCHMRLFTYKVVVEIIDSSGKTVLECFGDPKRNKKAAAEHAAQGALWYLEHVRQNQTKPHQ